MPLTGDQGHTRKERQQMKLLLAAGISLVALAASAAAYAVSKAYPRLPEAHRYPGPRR